MIGLMVLGIFALVVTLLVFETIWFLGNVFDRNERQEKSFLFWPIFFAFCVWMIYIALVNSGIAIALFALFFLFSHLFARFLKIQGVFPKLPRKAVYFYSFVFFSVFQTILFFGYGYIVPNFLRPSYYTQFMPLCRLNQLSDNEEKFNKILGLVKLNLDNLDYKFLNQNLVKDDDGYIATILAKQRNAYAGNFSWVLENVDDFIWNYPEIESFKIKLKTQQNFINRKNIHSMRVSVFWKSHRYVLDWSNTRFEFDLRDSGTIMCSKAFNDK